MVVATQQTERVRLDLDGMTCASCATRIERKLNKLEGVEATVNYATDQAAVTYDSSAVSVDDLVAAVEAAGYHAALPGDAVESDRAGTLKVRLVTAAVLFALAVIHRGETCGTGCTKSGQTSSYAVLALIIGLFFTYAGFVARRQAKRVRNRVIETRTPGSPPTGPTPG